MMELSEDFLKMIQIALMIVGLLVIFLIFISYNIEVVQSEAKRDTYVLGDYLLASKCLVLEEDGNIVKGVFSEEKLDSVDPSCIKYPYGSIKIELLDGSGESWLIGDSEIEGGTEFIVAVKLENGDIKPAKMTVNLGAEEEEEEPPQPPTQTCDEACKLYFNDNSYSGACRSGITSPSGMLHVEGTKIVDENGNEVHLKGTLVDWNERRKKKGSPGSTTMALSIAEAFFQEDDVILMKSHGANCFEVHLDPFNDWTTTIGNLDTAHFTNWMDHWVNWATNNQMYVILDIGPFKESSSWVIPSWIWSAAGYAQPTTKEEWDKVIRDFFDTDVTAMDASRQGFIDVWKKVALRYIDNPYVIFSIMDEPLNGVDITGMGAHLGQTYSKFMTDVVDGIRSTGSNHIIIIDRPWVCFHPPNYYDNIQPVNREGIVWRGAAYMGGQWVTDFSSWCDAMDDMINRFIVDFGKPYYASGFGFSPIQDGKTDFPDTWISILEDQINYLISKGVCGRNYHAWGFLEEEVYDWVYNYFTAGDSDYILQTIFGGTGVGGEGLRVVGDKIVDENGREIRLKGFQTYTSHSGKELTQEDYDQIASWGLNAIRTTVWWGSQLEPDKGSPGVYDEAYMNHLDKHIRMAEKAGLYWIPAIRVSYNDADTPDNPPYSWWGWGRARDVCTPSGLERYANCVEWFVKWLESKDYSNLIGYDPWLFPFHQTSVSESQRTFFYGYVMPRLAEVVRENSDKIIFLNQIHQGEGDSSEILNIPSSVIEANRGRACYGLSFYKYEGMQHSGNVGVWNYNYQWQRDYLAPPLDFRSQNNVPLYVVEFGVRGESQDQVDCLDYKLQLLEENGISWPGYWSYCSYGSATGFCILNQDDTPKWELVNTLRKYSQTEYDIVTTPVTGGTCQSGETSIGQDGCASGVCCCSGVLQKSCNEACQDQGFANGVCRASDGAGLSIKATNTPANQLFSTSSTYPPSYWGLGEPDLAWKLLRDAGTNVIRIWGGPEGNVLKIQMNPNHPYGRTYNSNWAENLEAILAKADSYGMKVAFFSLGTTYGTQLGIVPPMCCYARYTDENGVNRYTPINEALALIDKLGGDNSLGKNFLADPRVAWWEPCNECRLDYNDVREWIIAVSDRIRSYGGKVTATVNDGAHPYWQSFPYILPIIGDHFDYLSVHIYNYDEVKQLCDQGTSTELYTTIYNRFKEQFQHMISTKGSFLTNQLIVKEFACGNGRWRVHSGKDYTYTTEQQQTEYIQAAFDAARDTGITNLCWHAPIHLWHWTNNNYRGRFGFIDYDGTIFQEAYLAFKAGKLSTTTGGGCQSGETPIDDDCPTGQTCCCSETEPSDMEYEYTHMMWLLPHQYLPWKGHYFQTGLGNEFDNPQYLIDNLKGMNIGTIIIKGGGWKSDGTIYYDSISTGVIDEDLIASKWQNLITEVRKAYPQMKFQTWLGLTPPDLSNPSIRAKMCESAKAFVLKHGFDGFNDDIEGWNGDLVHLKNYYREMTDAIHSIGKEYTIATAPEYWGGVYDYEDYAYILNSDIDAITPMFYAGSRLNSVSGWDEILQYSPCPVYMGIAVSDGGVWTGEYGSPLTTIETPAGTTNTKPWIYSITLDEQLEWFDARTKNSKFKGYSIWAYDHMSYEDMDTWGSWVQA